MLLCLAIIFWKWLLHCVGVLLSRYSAWDLNILHSLDRERGTCASSWRRRCSRSSAQKWQTLNFPPRTTYYIQLPDSPQREMIRIRGRFPTPLLPLASLVSSECGLLTDNFLAYDINLYYHEWFLNASISCTPIPAPPSHPHSSFLIPLKLMLYSKNFPLIFKTAIKRERKESFLTRSPKQYLLRKKVARKARWVMYKVNQFINIINIGLYENVDRWR